MPREYLSECHTQWMLANAADCVNGMDLATQLLSRFDLIDYMDVWDIAQEIFDHVMQQRMEEKYA